MTKDGPRYTTARCKRCGIASPDGWLSRNGFCKTCVSRAIQDIKRQHDTKSGPYYEKWKKAMIAHAKTLTPDGKLPPAEDVIRDMRNKITELKKDLIKALEAE